MKMSHRNVNSEQLSMIAPDATASSPRETLSDMTNDGVRQELQLQHECDATVNDGTVTCSNENSDALPNDFYLKDLIDQLVRLIPNKQSECPEQMVDDTEDPTCDPTCAPMFWIRKWVDHTDKGFGYQLCDNRIGVVLNDNTHIMMMDDESNLQYIDGDGQEHYYKYDVIPQEICPKVAILKYFCAFMRESLPKTGYKPEHDDDLVCLPYLNNWLYTPMAIVFELTNATVQINFNDNSILIFCPLMGSVTYVNEKRDFKTFKFNLIEKYGCSKEMALQLQNARYEIYRLMYHKLNISTVSNIH